MDTPRERSALHEWGEGHRSLTILVTGPFLRCALFHNEIGGEDFGRRGATSRLRVWLPAGEGEPEAVARMADAAQRAGVTLELLHGCASTEWYELISLAKHGNKWGKEP